MSVSPATIRKPISNAFLSNLDVFVIADALRDEELHAIAEGEAFYRKGGFLTAFPLAIDDVLTVDRARSISRQSASHVQIGTGEWIIVPAGRHAGYLDPAADKQVVLKHRDRWEATRIIEKVVGPLRITGVSFFKDVLATQ